VRRADGATAAGADTRHAEGQLPATSPLHGRRNESRDLDTFGGNSGSGVYLHRSPIEVAGILVRGATDYVHDAAADCYRVNRCPDDGCGGELSTYAWRAVEAYCAVGTSQRLCGTWCGDGRCGPDETAATCTVDCQTPAGCGDGVCAGRAAGEDCLTCPADCACGGRGCVKSCCGNGACERSEKPSSCPVDCGS
jgi:hypothetical protein